MRLYALISFCASADYHYICRKHPLMKQLASFIILLFAIFSTAASGYDSREAANSALADIPNWMKYLPDDVFVAHISIPGTHDAATGEGWIDPLGPSLATTQSATIDEQLNAGIRAFDFRPGLHQQDGVDYLNCDHGMVATLLRFREALMKLTSYLDSHPTEFMAIHLFRANVRNEADQTTRNRFNALTDKIFNSGTLAEYFVDFDPELRVSDVRGRIIVFRRDKMAYADIHCAGNLSEWPSDKELWTDGASAAVVNASSPQLSGRIRVTDVSSPKNEDELNTELQSIKNLVAYNADEATPNESKATSEYLPTWTMIFTSGCYPVESTAGYLTNATKTNPLLIKLLNEYSSKGPLGIVFSDWVLSDTHRYLGKSYETKGKSLVNAIIAHNFSYISDYILDEMLFGEEASRLPDGKFFLRNIGSGKFIGAGAEAGAQAVLSDYPVWLSASGSGENEYMLRTTFRRMDKDNFLGEDFMLDSGKGLRLSATNTGRAGAFIFSYTDSKGHTVSLAPKRADFHFGDGTDSIISSVPYERSDPWQQWQVITGEDLIRERIADINPETGCNLSFVIRGTQFYPNDSENDLWLPAEKGSQIKTEFAGTSAWNDRVQVLRIYNPSFYSYQKNNYFWRISRTISGLPDGKYTISVLAHAGGTDVSRPEQLSFTANGTDLRECVTLSQFPLGAEEIMHKFRASGERKQIPVTVSNGTLTVDISGDAAGAAVKTEFAFRDFALTYFGPAEESAIVTPETTSDGPLSVYSITGILLRHNIQRENALPDLPCGIYILATPDGARQKVIKR